MGRQNLLADWPKVATRLLLVEYHLSPSRGSSFISSGLVSIATQRAPHHYLVPRYFAMSHPISKMISTLNNKETHTRTLWRAADCICFDVDSTVCTDEAIDELAKFAGREKEVSELTKRAMRGGMTFREALSLRLDLIKPSHPMITNYLKNNPPQLTPGIQELVTLLHSRDVDVYLVSGGFHCIIEPVAKQLGIPIKNIFANRLKFYFNGDYAGFDETQPTSLQDGKARVAAYLKQKHGYKRLVMVGDGATDLAASPPADGFIGFGGNQVRETVKREANWFVTSFYELTEELNRN